MPRNGFSPETIISMLGLADRGNIFDLMDSIFNGDAQGSLELYNKIYQSGADVLMIFDEMLKVTHFLTQMKISQDIRNDIQIPEFERNKGSEMADKISMSSLGIVWQVLYKGYQELQSGLHLFQHGEMLIIRLIYLYEGPSPDDLVKKIEKNIEKNKDQNNSIKIEPTQNETPLTINKADTLSMSDKVDDVEKMSVFLSVKNI